MDPILIAALIILLLIIVGAVFFLQRRKSDHLRSRFGPEYDRAVEDSGGKRKAESELTEREKRVQALHIRPLSPEDRERFTGLWERVQAEFVDSPGTAIADADALVGDVMSARGYPVSDFEQVASDLSVDHPVVVKNYRAGHAIAVDHRDGRADTEDLRQAMIHYRTLFDELVHDRHTTEEPSEREAPPRRR